MLKPWREFTTSLFRIPLHQHFDQLRQDAGHAVRAMGREPGFTAVALLTLGLGIGANTAIFSVVNAILLRPLPFKDDGRLVRVYLVRNNRPPHISPRPNLFLELEKRGRFFQSLAGQRFTDMTLSTPDGPERVSGMAVSHGWQETLGVQPVLGRGFSAEDAAAGPESSVVIVSHGFWKRSLGLDPGALGQSVTVDGRNRTIVGIMPPGFNFPYNNDIWFPLDFGRQPEGRWGVNLQARLRPGVSLAAARAEARVLGKHFAQEFPVYKGMDMILVPTREVLLGDNSKLVLVLLGAVGFVLLIACANVSSLMLSRSIARRKELTIRAALGATRSRQVRQLLTESLVLSLSGGAVGVGLAFWGNRFLTDLIPGRMAYVLGGIPLDRTVLAFTVAAAVLAGLLFGLLPALRASRTDLQDALREGGRAGRSGGHRLLGGLVVGEMALTLVLLAGAGLLLQNFKHLHRMDLGYPIDNALSFEVNLTGAPYADTERRHAFVRRALDELRRLPLVKSAGVANILPLSGGNFLSSVAVEDRPAEPGQEPLVNSRLVSPGLLEALGVPLLRGRYPSEADQAGALPVVVVSRALAERYWPGEDPLGKRVRNARLAENPWITVVGVVEDVREFYDVKETWYRPHAQGATAASGRSLTFIVRVDALSDSLGGELRQAVWAVDGTLPVFRLESLAEKYGQTLSGQRLSTWLVGLFALVGLALAALGIYGVMSYTISLRTSEFGIRMALGAGPGRIMVWVLSQGALLAGLGVLLGLAGTAGLSRVLAGVLSEVRAAEPATLLGVAALLFAVALAACYVPARRAMKVEPLVALRYE